MILVFHPEARIEFRDATLYYIEKSNRVGREFDQQVRAVLAKIKKHPRSGPILDGEVSFCTTHRQFPYKVLCVIEPHEIFIVAVMHNSRRPGYWKNRLFE